MVDDGCHQNFELTLCGQAAFQNRTEGAQLRRRLKLTKIDRFAGGALGRRRPILHLKG